MNVLETQCMETDWVFSAWREGSLRVSNQSSTSLKVVMENKWALFHKYALCILAPWGNMRQQAQVAWDKILPGY